MTWSSCVHISGRSCRSFSFGTRNRSTPCLNPCRRAAHPPVCLLFKTAGVTLGIPSAKEFIPDHHLAMSTLIDPYLPAIELTHQEALNYLRKEELHPETTHRGWSLVQYAGHNLGWIKVLPNRSNNYYPKEWRILKRE